MEEPKEPLGEQASQTAVAASASPLNQEPHTYHPTQDKILCWMEFITVVLIFGGMLLLIGFAFFWVFFGFQEETCSRLVRLIEKIDTNWKAGLLVTVLLFYRPLRRFLDKLKRFGAVDTEQPSPSQPKQEEYKKG